MQRRAKHSHEEDQAQGAGTATKRTKLKEHADGYHSGARETRAKGTVTGHEEEEQCRRSRHQVMRRRSSVKGVSGPDIDRTEGSSPLRSGDHFKAPSQHTGHSC
ncbi:hypothetical protein NDA14_002735 [Ustilago hordei]|nr:hypothetical protein NDA14_002735 [Ustilago hordei]